MTPKRTTISMPDEFLTAYKRARARTGEGWFRLSSAQQEEEVRTELLALSAEKRVRSALDADLTHC